jgi:hypothetical protein
MTDTRNRGSTGMTAHRTPGSWHYSPHCFDDARGHIYIDTADGPCTIGLTAPRSASQEWLDAKARLIAAVPELLAALRPFADGECYKDHSDDERESADGCPHCLACSVIAKVEDPREPHSGAATQP